MEAIEDWVYGRSYEYKKKRLHLSQLHTSHQSYIMLKHIKGNQGILTA